jgi:type I restriction enzyme S subunit
MSEKIELPSGWSWSIVKDVAKSIQYGFTQSSSKIEVGPKFLRITDIQDNKVNWEKVPFCEISNSEKPTYLLDDGDLVFARTGATVGKSFLLKGNIPEAIFASYLIRLRFPKSILDKYIWYFFQSPLYWKQIGVNQVGTGQPNVNGTVLGSLRIPISPFAEQHRIVSKIEELFSSLDKGVESLRTAQQQLKVYRQAVLKWAFDKSWIFEPFSKIAYIKRGRSKHRPRDAKELYGGRYPFIQTGEIRAANGGTVRSFEQTYSEIGLAQSKLWPEGTLCLTIAANIGETAFLGFDACFPDSVVGITPKDDRLNPKFINYYLQKTKQEIDRQASATAQKNINVEFLEKLLIPLPDLPNQNLAVLEIETRLSVCDKIEESIEQSLQQAEALRQSILKKAFEGKLVPQDPNDEPASVLLERIRVENEKTAVPGKLKKARKIRQAELVFETA